MLKSIADLDKTQYSISELTIKLAKDAGYYRGLYTFKNGNTRLRTMYKYPFNNILAAKWIYSYKKLFISKLYSHPEYSEYYTFIINRTFSSVMNNIQLEKITSDNIIHKYTNLALIDRLGEVLYEIGSQSRLQDYNNGKKLKFRLKKISNTLVQPLEDLCNNGYDIDDELSLNLDPIVLDLKSKLETNPIGNRVLYSILYSNKKIQLDNICDYIYLSEDEKNEETKNNIIKALNTIISYLSDNNIYTKKNFKPIKNISFNRKIKIND